MPKQKEKIKKEEMKEIEEKLRIQKETALEIARCLDLIFNLEKQLKKLFGDHFVEVNYSISCQEGSEIFFAEFKINEGLTKIERTFLFDIYNEISGFEPDRYYLENEIKRFLMNIKNLN